MIVYLARDIPVFVMYCVYEESRSSLLIESTNSMILYWPFDRVWPPMNVLRTNVRAAA